MRLIYAGLYILLILFFSCTTEKPEAETEAPKGADWAAEVVWYQIFPERFWNGDTQNDPTPADMEGGWPYFTPEDWQISPWTSDWYAYQPWERGIPWHEHFDWAKKGEPNFGATAGLRRYGGDLQGVLDRLDYLQELGVDGLYFNPLFESPSLHKYNASMYHHIDNNFGPDPAGDAAIWEEEDPADPSTWKWTAADSLFLKLIEECHKRGMYVVLDGVFNHVGRRFWAFEDVVENQQASAYKDWFSITSWDDPQTPENEFAYEGWLGIRDLPELVESDSGFAPGVNEHFKAVIQRWMDPNNDGDPSDGIDGWRLDVAEKVRLEFWGEFRQWVLDINPNAYLVGEVWWEEYDKNKIFDASPWFENAFDGVMNYRFARAVKQYVIDSKTKISSAAFADSVFAVLNDYPDNKFKVWSMLSGHDVDRLASQIQNPDRWYDHAADVMNNPNYVIQKPGRTDRLKQRLIVGMQMTLPGAPLIYYGDEVGMWGGDDPSCRKPMVWEGLNYSPEKSHPLPGRRRPTDIVEVDKDLLDFYKTMVRIRKDHRALSVGETTFYLKFHNQPNILSYKRSLDNTWLLVVLNNSSKAGEVELPTDTFEGSASVVNIINDSHVPLSGGVATLTMQPFEIAVLLPGKR